MKLFPPLPHYLFFFDSSPIYLSVWVYGLICFFILFTMSSTPFFLPAVVEEFGMGAMLSNLLSSIPYFFAVILLNINSRHSDKTSERPFHIIGK
jgi:hypothetical protein